jgi:predicted RNA-binding protein YlxR (DUF448 family)
VPRPDDQLRECALTRESKPVGELIRFVVGPDDVLVPDTDAKAEGRGVWITLGAVSIATAVKKNAFAKSLKSAVTLPDDLPELTRLRLEQRLLGALGMTKKAGQITTGATKVKAAIESGQVIALFTASDGSADGRDKLLQSVRGYERAMAELKRERAVLRQQKQEAPAGSGSADDDEIDDGDDGEILAVETVDNGVKLPHFEMLAAVQLDLALGLENVIHAALNKGAAAQSALARAERLARYIAN